MTMNTGPSLQIRLWSARNDFSKVNLISLRFHLQSTTPNSAMWIDRQYDVNTDPLYDKSAIGIGASTSDNELNGKGKKQLRSIPANVLRIRVARRSDKTSPKEESRHTILC